MGDDLLDRLERYLHSNDGMLEVFNDRRQLIRSWGGTAPLPLAECVRIALELPDVQQHLRVVTVLPTREIIRAWDRNGLIDFEGVRVYLGVRYRAGDELWVSTREYTCRG